MKTAPFFYYNASGVMDAEELGVLEDAILFHRSHELEKRVREMAALCAESCLASGKPWRCHFMEPMRAKAAVEALQPAATHSNEITVDVRGVGDHWVATLLAEEQIRRQLAKLPWARLPDLSASR